MSPSPALNALNALRDKRARIAGHIEAAERTIAKHREALAFLDATILMFEPASSPELIAPIRPVSVKCLFFRRGERRRLCFQAMWEAGKPVTTRHVADYALAAKGLTPPRLVREKITEQMRASLAVMAKRGVVRKVVEVPDVWWELVG